MNQPITILEIAGLAISIAVLLIVIFYDPRPKNKPDKLPDH